MTKNKESLKQLDTELAHAGEATTLSPQMLLLEQLRITPESQLKPMDFLFELYGRVSRVGNWWPSRVRPRAVRRL